MPETDLDAVLWMESELEDKPVGARSRDELIVVETPAIEWRDAEVCAPFEILLMPWGDSRTLCSSAFARPLGGDNLPWVALGSHKTDGSRKWQGGGAEYNEPASIERHLRRALPALLRRRLWGRVLWLDRELHLADETSGVLRLYLGANGQGEWFLPGFTEMRSVRAAFDWKDANRAALLLRSSDEELLKFVHTQAEMPESDLAFSLNWVSWGTGSAAIEKREMLHFRFARGSLEEMLQVLRWAIDCEPELRAKSDLMWSIKPLAAPDLDDKRSVEALFDGRYIRPLPPLSRRVREWAHDWFGATIDEEIRARHRCMTRLQRPVSFAIEREKSLSAHEQLEAFAQLRDFLASRVAPDELEALLKSD